MAIRAIVFDIGGVLEFTPPTGWPQRWEQRLGLETGELERRMAELWREGSLSDISDQEVAERTAAALDLDQAQLEAFMADLWNEYLGEPNVELAAYFASLRPRYQTAIISNSFAGARRREQEHYGMCDRCDLIVYSHEVRLEKPDRRIYELACQRLGLRPEQIIFLDDLQINVDAARELGIHAILFENTEQAIAEIEALLSK